MEKMTIDQLIATHRTIVGDKCRQYGSRDLEDDREYTQSDFIVYVLPKLKDTLGIVKRGIPIAFIPGMPYHDDDIISFVSAIRGSPHARKMEKALLTTLGNFDGIEDIRRLTSVTCKVTLVYVTGWTRTTVEMPTFTYHHAVLNGGKFCSVCPQMWGCEDNPTLQGELAMAYGSRAKVIRKLDNMVVKEFTAEYDCVVLYNAEDYKK